MKEKSTKRRKKHRNPFLKLGIGIAILVGVFLFLNSPLFTVEQFTVDGNSYYLEEEILTMGNCKTGGNIFWGTDYVPEVRRVLGVVRDATADNGFRDGATYCATPAIHSSTAHPYCFPPDIHLYGVVRHSICTRPAG